MMTWHRSIRKVARVQRDPGHHSPGHHFVKPMVFPILRPTVKHSVWDLLHHDDLGWGLHHDDLVRHGNVTGHPPIGEGTPE